MINSIQQYTRKIFLIPPHYFYFCIALSVATYYLFPVAKLILFPANLILGLPLVGAGCYLLMGSVFLFKKNNTSKSFQKSACVVTSGFYAFSRNPMYLGFVIFLLGLSLSLGNAASLISPLFFFIVINSMFIPYEEEKMEIEIGEEYLAYKEKVRRWL
jgi:protein-S-isoprenylcysteine O-methyltransferase Ste14